MSSLRPNSTTLFLRPIEYQQRYRIKDAAKWLTYKGYFTHPQQALTYLLNLEHYRPWIYKNIMADFYDAVDYQTKYKSSEYSNNYDINFYQTSNYNRYGQEEHMWF